MIRRVLIAALLLAWVRAPVLAQSPGGEAALRARLDAARGAIEARRYDRALADLRPIVADATAEPGTRVEALALHAWASFARGRVADAEKDWRRILESTPEFTPPPDTLSDKGRARFRALRAKMIGDVAVTVDPADAALSVDGRPVSLTPEGTLPLPAGTHRVAAAHAGFDPVEEAIEVLPGKDVALRLELVANAGALALRTTEAGVNVRIDGSSAGVTAHPDGASEDVPAELRLEGLALGEHRVELEKPCRRSMALTVSVDANLLDRTARVVGPLTLEPATGRIDLRGGPDDGEVWIDGERAGPRSQGPFARCPGPAAVELRLGDRSLWRSTAEVSTDTDTTMEVTPRPNVELFGSADPPAALDGRSANLGWRQAGELPAGIDPRSIEAWRRARLPADADLVLALVPGPSGGPRSWIVVSPALGTVEDSTEPMLPDRPAWLEGDIGMEVADSAIGGVARVVRVRPEGPAARAGIRVGERIVEVDGHAITSARDLRGAIDGAGAGTSLSIRVERSPESVRAVRLLPARRARAIDAPGSEAWTAAWARADAASGAPDAAAAALANLARLLAGAGLHRESADAWERAAALASPALCAGTAAYHRGVELESIGSAAQAREAFRTAAASACEAFGAPEALVSPIAAERLSAAPSAR